MTKPRGTVGASDVAALFDCHPYLSRYSLWARECGLLAHLPDEHTERQQMGLDLEPAILSAWARDENHDAKHNTDSWPHPTIKGASATPDGIVSRHGSFVATAQIKTVQPWERGPYLVGIPPHHFLQVQQEIGCLSVSHGYLICQFGFEERATSRIEREDSLQFAIAERIAEFWKRVSGELPPPPPDDHKATLEAQMRFRRESETIDFGDERVAEMMHAMDVEYIQAQAQLREAKKRDRAAKTKLLNALGKADRGVFPDGSGYAVKRIGGKKPHNRLVRFTGENTEDGEDE